MAYTFQQGSTLLLTDGVRGRELLISSLSVSQTFLEESRSVRTLHSPKVIEHTFSNSKSNVSLDFSCQLTSGDGILFEWLGFTKSLNTYNITTTPELVAMDVFVITNSSVYKISNTYITNLSLQMNKTGALSVQVNATGSNWTEQALPFTHAYTKQSSADFIHGFLNLAGSTNLGGLTLEITRGVSWIQNNTVHNSLTNNIYTPDKALIDDMSISGTATFYKVDNSLDLSLDKVVDFTYGGVLRVYLDNCKELERWETNDIYRKQKDFKLLPSSTNAYIQF